MATMFYRTQVKDHIRVSPELFTLELKEAIVKQVKQQYDGFISKEVGIVIDVLDIKDIKDGVIIPGDGAPYYETVFELLTYKPELQEVCLGKVRDIADFGAFITLGPLEGMVHVSQTMDDFVSFSKDKVLLGKESKRSIKIGDLCKAKIIALSYKDITNPKIGLTMRQPGLGKLEWADKAPEEKKEKTSGKETKGKKEK